MILNRIVLFFGLFLPAKVVTRMASFLSRPKLWNPCLRNIVAHGSRGVRGHPIVIHNQRTLKDDHPVVGVLVANLVNQYLGGFRDRYIDGRNR